MEILSSCLLVVQAYEIVEEEAKKAERARAQAKRAKEFMENQMLQVRMSITYLLCACWLYHLICS